MPAVGYQGRCHYCGEEVNSTLGGVAYAVVGWEAIRAGGGANQIIMRTRVPEKVAHVHCARRAADRQRRGIAQEQEVLDLGFP
jgi:hypothetical protein